MYSLFNGHVPKVQGERDGNTIEQLEDSAGVKNPPFDELLAEAAKNERSGSGRARVIAGLFLCGLVAALVWWAKSNGLI